MARKTRLDAELVRRGLARSRQHAGELVHARRVTVSGLTATKLSTGVDPAASVRVAPGAGDDVVSRGAHKLGGALDHWSELTVRGRRCLDAGASTGGFTQTLLRRGAREVMSVDVGYGQLAWSLRGDARVQVFERVNVRHLTAELIGGRVELIVADLSFISLVTVLPALRSCLGDDGDAVLLVKPQFEVGRTGVGPGGVVRDAALRAGAVRRVVDAAHGLGLGCRDVVASPLPGPAGNVEYFLWLRPGTRVFGDAAIEAAVSAGPV